MTAAWPRRAARRAAIGLVAGGAALAAAACSFDRLALDALRPCTSRVDCTSPLSPFCVAGYCVPGAPGDPGAGEGEGEGGDPGEGEGEGEGDGGPDGGGGGGGAEGEDGPAPVAVLRAPAASGVGDIVGLDGAASTGDGLSYTFSARDPDGVAVPVAPDGDREGAASFVALRRGTFTVGLRVEDRSHRVDLAAEREVEILGFEVLDKDVAAADVWAVPSGDAAWIAVPDGAWRALRPPPAADAPDAAREWAWTFYDGGGGQGTDRVTADARDAWFARSVSGALRVRRDHAEADPRAATPVAVSGVGRVRAMVVGPAGRVWFGGDEGLRRSAGTEGGALGPPLSLPPERPRGVLALATSPGGLWVGQARKGACRVAWTEEATLPCEAEADVLPGVDARLTALAVDAAGRLWIATAGQGLYRRDEGGGITAIAPGARGTPAGGFEDLEADPDGALWGVAAGELYRLYDGGERVERLGAATGLPALGDLRAVHVSAGESGAVAVWVAAARGVGFRLRP